MNPPKQRMRERLYLMFHQRLVRMWKDNPPISRNQDGDACLESRLDVAQKWRDYVENMGGIVMEWNATSGDGILVTNPCESPEDFRNKHPLPTNILLPMELATKILALGDLPC